MTSYVAKDGENLGEFIIKEPKIKNLKFNKEMTKKIKKAIKKDKIEIIFKMDKDLMVKLKEISKQQGTKYQTVMNNILRQSLSSKNTLKDRLTNLEKEVKKIKKMVL
jgi:uncharacterized protein (DUF4415 family)